MTPEDFRRIIQEELSKQTDEMKATIAAIQLQVSGNQNEIKLLKEENRELQHRLNLATQKISAVEKENDENKQKWILSETKWNDNEQYQKRVDLLISGVPKVQKETKADTMGIMMNILKVLNITYEKWEILGCHRLHPRKTGDTPIIMKFNRPEVRDRVLEAAKTGWVLLDRQASVFHFRQRTSGNQPKADDIVIYFNEHLTRNNQILLRKAKQLRTIGFKYVWSKNGSVFVKANDAGRTQRIFSEEDVNRCLHPDSNGNPNRSGSAGVGGGGTTTAMQ